MSGSTYTQGIQFGVSSGPTYTGTYAVLPPANGNVVINPQAFIPAGNSPVTIYTESINFANVQAFGAFMQVINQVGTANTAVTVTLKGASTAGADLAIPLAARQAVSYPSAASGGWIHNTNTPISITVTPDPYSNTEVDMLIVVSQ